MAEHTDALGTTPVTDRRPVPRGVLPKGIQTWLMAALAMGMLLIIFLTGQPDAPAGARAATAVPQAPNADRVRDYQDRLRMLDVQADQETRAAAAADTTLPPAFDDDRGGAAPVDPTTADRQRREYESLFASNVVLSRRRDAERPDAGSGRATPRIQRHRRAEANRPSMRSRTPSCVPPPAAVASSPPPYPSLRFHSLTLRPGRRANRLGPRTPAPSRLLTRGIGSSKAR